MGRADTHTPNRGETFAGLVILAVLAAVGTWLFIVQGHFNPAVDAWRQPAPLGEPALEAALEPLDALFDPPEGLVPMSRWEQFSGQTLSDKINGKAELYLAAGFRQLKTQRFRDGVDPNLWMELYAYHMGSAADAFAVFSAQRRDGAVPLDLTTNAYATANALFFTHGPYYVEIVSASAEPGAAEHLLDLARGFINARRVETPRASRARQSPFPPAGRQPDSLARIARNGFGFEHFDNVDTAEYRLGDASATAFVSRRPTEAAARDLAAGYIDFLKAYGGRVLPWDSQIAGARLIEIMGLYEVVFAHQNAVAGVHEADDRRTAVALATDLHRHLGKESR